MVFTLKQKLIMINRSKNLVSSKKNLDIVQSGFTTFAQNIKNNDFLRKYV